MELELELCRSFDAISKVFVSLDMEERR